MCGYEPLRIYHASLQVARFTFDISYFVTARPNTQASGGVDDPLAVRFAVSIDPLPSWRKHALIQAVWELGLEGGLDPDLVEGLDLGEVVQWETDRRGGLRVWRLG